jgi:hypothetical protein
VVRMFLPRRTRDAEQVPSAKDGGPKAGTLRLRRGEMPQGAPPPVIASRQLWFAEMQTLRQLAAGAYDLRRGGIGLRSVRPPDTV